MKFKFFICLFVLLLPFYAAAKELTAIGFVEVDSYQKLIKDEIRLAFVRKDSGWTRSCFFEKFHSLVKGRRFSDVLSESSSCSHQIMKNPWQIINADGKYINVGTLKPSKATYGGEFGFVSIAKPLKTKLKFDSTLQSRYTWDGPTYPPLLAVPKGTRVEIILPKLTADSVSKEIKDEIIQRYLKKKRMMDLDSGMRAATPKDVVVKPVYTFQDGMTFCEVSTTLLIDSAYCDMTSTANELFVVKNGLVKNVSEETGVRGYMCIPSLALFHRYEVSTKNTKDSVFVLFAQGYNNDGYVLLDSELNVRAISTWIYH
ncbi:hypothetical protein [Fibrobacter sp. UWB7]|uniref:hypothetical protein n=1 Tax=Fibrobacter sp. UWB7 TaxID=1896206 RepID=UPI00091DB6B9|nr:hypothetical protein [Fibrobacter sp. UWB7]SHM10649.1 hypothetical protein SAMN05720467_0595 [Fibrobacter sp. UWB7]